MRTPDEPWRTLAAAQHGMLCRRQLAELGVGRNRVRNQIEAGRWVAASPMVVSTTTGPLSRDQLRWLGVLHAGPRALLGDLSAAEVHGLERWHRDEITVLVPQDVELEGEIEGIDFKRTRRPLPLMTSRLSLPTMKLEPAILHFAAYQHSPRTAQGVVSAAVQQRLTSAAALREWVRLMRPLRWAQMFRDCLDEIEGGATSMAELDIRRLCKRHRLARPARQVRRRGADGRTRYTDCEWTTASGHVVVLEIDGGFHMEVEHWEEDMARERSLAGQDRIHLRCPSRELRDEPDRVAADLIRLGVPRAGVVPVDSETISASCHDIPTGAPRALASASLAAKRAASDASGRVASSGVNSRSRSPGVRSRETPKRSMSQTSMPTPITAMPSPPARYSTVTDFARFRGWSTS